MEKSFIGRLSGSYAKAAAWAMYLLMYGELALPLAVKARTGPVKYQDIRRNRRLDFVRASSADASLPDRNSLTGSISSIAKKAASVSGKPETGGPGQPEMASFQSVNANNHVDLFSGDFSYNIPLMDVGGYPISIHYSSGITMDQEASWVGLGWNLNPGTINRNMRGLPDDFNGRDSITKIQNMRINKTVGARVGGGLELFGGKVGLSGNVGLFNNSYLGFGVDNAAGATLKISNNNKGSQNGSASVVPKVGLSFNNNSQTGFGISPSLLIGLERVQGETEGSSLSFGLSTGYHSRAGLSQLTITADYRSSKRPIITKYFSKLDGRGVTMSFATPSFTPSISMPVTSSSMNFQGKLGGSLYGAFAHIYIEGYVQQQYIRLDDQIQKKPAYGYIYFTEGNSNRNALLDFNREKEIQYNFATTPHIAIPQYTYDVYSISGEGVGGIIRPYRGEIGHVRDHQMTTRSTSDDLGIEGPAAHYGLNFERINSVTTYGAWNELNDIRPKLQFQQSDSNFQAIYFRNPAEKTANTSNYYESLGGDSLIRIKLNASNIQRVRASNVFEVSANGKIQRSMPVEKTIVKQSRDKRSQVVTYMTAIEAMSFALDRKIYAYQENEQPTLGCVKPQDTISRMDGLIRKGHHLSQVSVLNPDGRRYVYGIPAYNVEQHDVTFSVDKEQGTANLDSGMTSYSPGVDNWTANNKGKEAYYNQEKIPAYAHSFLLTGILSSDYTDLTDDGITEDDLGDGIKFNYSLVYGPGQGYYDWRTPGSKNKANYNEGLKTYSRDDKASYFYGKKEVWYLHSVESKNMIALFKVSADRKDAFAVLDSNGGLNTNKALRKLQRIDLYTKADLRKFGIKAKPIKTVHFEYSYDLCKGGNGNTQEGKLTLKRVWFSYNGNNKGKQNPYVFTYNSFNPGYHPRKYDRWGNYKDNASNPDQLSNADFPYVIQDSAAAARNVSAWHLTQVGMPSGGQMRVTYESDDYAYVQNRRSMFMTSILGFGTSPDAVPLEDLYSTEGHDYVFIEPQIRVESREDFYRLYLEGSDYLYMKLAVIMPEDQWGSGIEMVPLYGKIAGYGKVAGENYFWIKLEKTDGISAPLRAALQFLKNNLPSKAMPGSEVGSNVPLGKAVSVLASSAKQILNTLGGFEKQAIKKGWCKYIIGTKSMVRLNAPTYAKLGGGHRVKRIQVFDNWNKMTGQRESVYGQEYLYRTSMEVNGKKLEISSGVATYEPMIGNEENPFRQPIPYAERLAPMAPIAYLYSEMPLGESYFPGASVGYSKVRVRTIHSKTKSANGWQESEFYTAKDFPTQVEYTMLDGDSKKRFNPKINFLKIYAVDRVSVSQGFKVVLNDMHGKPKGEATYAETDSIHPIAYSRNFYREQIDARGRRVLNNTVPAIENQDGIVNEQTVIGKDIEVITDFREQKTVTVSAGIQPNVDVIIVITPLTVPMLFKIPTYDESLFRSAATVKVVQEYGILDSLVVYDKGSLVSTKNLVYDAETGDVLLSRTKNAFKDPVYNYSYPAHWAYSGMGPAYKNVDVILKNLQIHEGRLKDANGLDFPTEKYFESGDEIIVSGIQPVLKLSQENDCPLFVRLPLNSRVKTEKIWAFDIRKTREVAEEGLGDGIFFIDRNGKPYTGLKVSLRIIRSGKRNLAGSSIGSVVSMKNPIRTSDGRQRIVWNDSSMVLNASAASFRDLWAVDNSLYSFDSCYTKTDTIVRNMMVPESSMLMRQYLVKGASIPLSPTANLLNDPHFTAGVQMFSACATNPVFKCKRFYAVKSIIKYDFSGIPSNANILSATLSLNSLRSSGIWNNNDPDNLNWSALNRAHYLQGSNPGSRNNNANLKVVVSPWNQSTPYNNISTGTSTVQVIGAPNLSCDNRSLNVLSLAREAITNPSTYHGFILQLNQASYVDVASELRTLSFGSGRGSFLTPDPVKFTDTCTTTLPPYLSIRYTVSKDTCVRVCRRNINDTMVNPYVWGILGNWRVDRAYTYFSERQSNSTIGTQTDIRRDGLIKDFAPFWTAGTKSLNASSDSARWVWNSTQSIFGRKGFELENYDALYRYNAGRYGYEESLPVAVAQNSKQREIFYAGFEDASYATQNCKSCPTPQDLAFAGQGSDMRYDSSQSHSGIYSLRVASGTQATARIPVVSLAKDTASIYLKANLNKTPVYGGGFTVEGKGNGLSAGFTGYSNAGGCPSEIVVERGGLPAPNIDYQLFGEAPYTGVCPQNLDINWSGYVQPVYTDTYTFYMSASGYFSIYIQVNGVYYGFTGIGDGTEQEYTIPLQLQAGTIYPIQITMFNTDPGFFITWSWSGSLYQAKEVVPQKQLYTNPAVAAGSLVPKVSRYCVSLKNIQPFNVIRPGVSPIQGRSMVLSAWVKLDGEDCLTAPIPDNSVVLSFNASNQSSTPMIKTGPRIEGWQRMEARVTIPTNATTLNIRLNGAGDRAVLFDDVRMQPYNSAMKTYVYDPVSLRLMAELDENNYSTFYEYDDDGTLIRVKKETERGIMTIRETRSALIKEGN